MRPKYKGFEKVDAYLIPKKEAGVYKRNRKLARKAAIKAFRQSYPTVITDWAGSEDGEGVLALDKNGTLIACVHLDPEGIALILEGMKNNNLLQLLLEINDIQQD